MQVNESNHSMKSNVDGIIQSIKQYFNT